MTRQIKVIPPLQVTVSGTVPVTVNSIKPVKNPVVTNVMTSAAPNTETSFTVTAIKRLEIYNKGSTTVQLSYAAGTSGTMYLSLTLGSSYIEDNIDDQTIVVYVQASLASQRLEVVTWQ